MRTPGSAVRQPLRSSELKLHWNRGLVETASVPAILKSSKKHFRICNCQSLALESFVLTREHCFDFIAICDLYSAHRFLKL